MAIEGRSPPGQAASPAPTAVPMSPPPADAPSHVGWIYAAGGVGLASLAVAGVTGGLALAEKAKASPVCNAQGMCTSSQGVSAGNEARTLADVETGALMVGGLALAAALVLWWTEPHPRSAAHGMSVVWLSSGWAAVW